ncbi:MAG: hypothetical protein KGI08_04625, partial [Thaumarchaeota archaeon]|nr:hypothetical protein [Nitrososphaerota archaeon]
IDVTEYEIIEIEAAQAPRESFGEGCTKVIPHAPIEPIALAAVDGGYKPDCSLMELNQAIRVIQQYHVLQREKQTKIRARLDMIRNMH